MDINFFHLRIIILKFQTLQEMFDTAALFSF